MGLKGKLSGAAIVCALTALSVTPKATAGEFASLEPNQKLASFTVEAVYINENGADLGARFRHEPSGFVLDVLRIQSLPQSFMWVNSPPPSDQGEPHTLEHLLLGKGNKGRYVASLEDMSLGNSSAYTEQRRTCYHFNTAAGVDVFFNLFHAKLDAMLNPNFTDEEIRREVCNMGLTVDQETGGLDLEEKGTVYNEMVSSYERPWGNLYHKLTQMIYGRRHPLALDAGGFPDSIRTMSPEDIRNFHSSTHHLNNMGAVVSIGDEVSLQECMTRLSGILSQVEPEATSGDDPASLWSRLPAPSPAPYGQVALTHFPNQNENEPGLMVYAWPAERQLNSEQLYMLELFLDLLASGQTSNLHRKFIDSQTREMDLGSNAAFYWLDDEPGMAIFLGFSNVKPEICTEANITKIRGMVMDEIKRVTNFADGSDELKEFNERALNRVTQDRRGIRDFLNSPPRFGYRGSGSSWINHLQRLHREGGFQRDLSQVADLAKAEELLSSGKNFWKTYMADWKLLEHEPYGVATTADPKMLTEGETAREARVDAFISNLKREHELQTDSAALALYKEMYDANTVEIDSMAATVTLPKFVDNPPLSLDESLQYETLQLPGGGNCVASTFENMTSAYVGVTFDLRAVPPSHLIYVPALPTMIRDIGVNKDGRHMTYTEVDEAIRKDALDVSVYFDNNFRTERSELTIRGAGSALDETQRALTWVNTLLFNSDLSVENIARIRDAVDLDLKSARNRTRGSEESWVNTPVYSYWKQSNPLLLQSECFLTQVHSLHRLRWMLKDAEGQEDQFAYFVNQISEFARSSKREKLQTELEAVKAGKEDGAKFVLPANAKLAQLCKDAVEDLTLSLSEIPDASLSSDIAYLCKQMSDDLSREPATVLGEIRDVIGMLRHKDNTRAFIVSNSADRKVLKPELDKIVTAFSDGATTVTNYAGRPVVNQRLAQRGVTVDGSVFVALVNENTRAGVHIHTADCASYETTDPEKLLRFLSARLYGGGGAHSMFMKTWGAGLAYSNGLRSNENYGRLIYYAERCPDLAQTLQFVVNELKTAPYDESLAEYAVAQAFVGNRSGDRYEQRGESMAADLADGLTEDVVSSFRSGILDLREDPKLYDKLHSRMVDVYGEVLPGLGPDGASAHKNSNAIYYVIGPEKQIQSWQDYLASVEPNAKLVRIYPRDYWDVQTIAN